MTHGENGVSERKKHLSIFAGACASRRETPRSAAARTMRERFTCDCMLGTATISGSGEESADGGFCRC